jgi:hypothetical protein
MGGAETGKCLPEEIFKSSDTISIVTVSIVDRFLGNLLSLGSLGPYWSDVCNGPYALFYQRILKGGGNVSVITDHHP